MWKRVLLRRVLAIVATILLAGLVSASLARFAPGFDADESQLDSRLSRDSVDALRAQHRAASDIFSYFGHYIVRSVHGDWGMSESLNAPVRGLIADRLPISVGLLIPGLLLGYSSALLLAVLSTAVVRRFDPLATVVTAGLLSLPAAVLALAAIYENAPASLAIAGVVFPKVFSYSRNLLQKTYSLAHVDGARARGIGPARIFAHHVLPIIGPQLLALAGVSVSVAIGAAIPIEALCGIGGIGSLAWQAAMARDIPLLIALTAVVTVVTIAANTLAEVLTRPLRMETA